MYAEHYYSSDDIWAADMVRAEGTIQSDGTITASGQIVTKEGPLHIGLPSTVGDRYIYFDQNNRLVNNG